MKTKFIVILTMIFFILPVSLFAQSNIDEDSIHFVGQASAFTVGSELVTDGDFPNFDNWTEGTGWTVASNKASQNNNASDLTQNITGLTDGRLYRIQYEITDFTDGLITSVLNDVQSGDKGAVGVYTSYLVATGTDDDLDMRGDASFTGSISNVSMVAWVGDLNAGGGCTIATFSGTLSDYMTATGGVLDHESGLALADSGGVIQIANGSLWDTQPKVGTLVKCDFSATFTDGIYEIVSASDDTIDIDLSSGGLGAETVEVWIGGAYPDIATAMNASTLAEDPDGTYRKRYICVNVDQEVDAVSVFSAETSETALREDDGSRKIIGFYDSISVVQPDAGYRVVSDMDEGGAYYGGAWQAFKTTNSFSDVRPNGKWIAWNAKGNDINIIELATSNFGLRNFKVHNTIADSSAEGLLHISTANFNTQLTNCWFAASSRFAVDDLVATGNGIVDCYFEDTIDSTSMVDFVTSHFKNCIIDLGSKTNGFARLENCSVNSCLIYQGTIGINQTISSSIRNSIFFDQTTKCIYLSSGLHVPNLFSNNIFSPAAAADIAIDILSGSLGSGFNNIIYSVSAGVVLTNPIVHAKISPNPALPVGTIEVDPLFVNSGDGDFRLRVSSLALNGGMRSLFDGRVTIGAWGPYALPIQERRPRYSGTPIYR